MYSISHFSKCHAHLIKHDKTSAIAHQLIFTYDKNTSVRIYDLGRGDVVTDTTGPFLQYSSYFPFVQQANCIICDQNHGGMFAQWIPNDNYNKRTVLCMNCFRYIKECYKDYNYLFNDVTKIYKNNHWLLTAKYKYVRKLVSSCFTAWEYMKVLRIIRYIDLNNDVNGYVAKLYKQVFFSRITCSKPASEIINLL